MNLIVAVDENWGIGKEGALLRRIPQDMKRFRALTMAGTLIMGRKTLQSFPGERPLSGRTNIVLSKDRAFHKEGVVICRNVSHARHSAGFRKRGVGKAAKRTVFVVGGEQIYKAFLPYCQMAYITKIHATFEADTFFCNLDEDPHWCLLTQSAPLVYEDSSFSYCLYKRNTKNL